MNTLTALMLLCVVAPTACDRAATAAAPLTVTLKSGRPLAGASVILARESAVPFQGKTAKDGSVVDRQLRGHGRLIISVAGVTVYKEMEKARWPCNLKWPVEVPDSKQSGVASAVKIRVLRADGTPVPNLKATSANQPHRVPGGGFKNLILSDGTTVEVTLGGELNVKFETSQTSVVVQFPECPFRQPFDITWPE